MMSKTEAYKWEFKPRFRRGAFGWRSQPAIKRVKEAVSEIKKVARREPLLAAEGAVSFLERVSPALEKVDGSSGAIGTAVYRAVETMVTIIAAADADLSVRRKWLQRLWKAIEADEIPYIESLDEHWGTICATAEIASEWADELLPLVRLVAESPGFCYSRATTVCFASLYKAGRYEELLHLLKAHPFRFDSYQAYAVRTLFTLDRKEEALAIADACRRTSVNGTPSIDQVLIEYMLAPAPVELDYGPAAFQALRKRTYIAWYRAVSEKFPGRQPIEILQDLIATMPGEEGKWFATAKELGALELAIRLANTSPCDPNTLSRAARDYLDKDAQFAMDAGRAALHWYLQGYGFDVASYDVLYALDTTMKAAAQLGQTDSLKAELRLQVEPKLKRRSNVAIWLAPRLGITSP